MESSTPSGLHEPLPRIGPCASNKRTRGGDTIKPMAQKGTVMKILMVGTPLFAVLALGGVGAHASCADPRVGAPQVAAMIHQNALPSHLGRDARENIVGTWRVSYTSGGAPFADAFIQWHADGTEWEYISLPTLSGNICMGSWKTVDQSHVSRNHYGWLFTGGVLSGWFNETETDEVAADGNSYTGVNETIIYDLSGNVQVKLSGTSAGTKIEP